jgi:hypothetical protein
VFVAIPFRDVTIQYVEVHARVTNQGPGTFAFDLQAEWSGASDPYTTPSATVYQRMGIGWVDQGWSADAWFSVDFLAQNFQVGPPGAPVLDASGIRYFNSVHVPSPGDKLWIGMGITSGATSNAVLRVEECWIRVKGVSGGQPVPEFEWSTVLLALSLASVFFLLKRQRRH